jgi:hypothetical protein
MNRLAIGHGSPSREGWTTLDARAGDIVAMIPPLPDAVKEQRWDVIEWIHGPASLYPWQLTALLAELRRALADDGVLVMETPNIERAAGSSVLRWIFGDPSYEDPLVMNHWGYTPETLKEALEDAGFSRIEVLPAQHHYPPRDFRIEARL